MMSHGIYSRLAIDPGVEERLRQLTMVNRESDEKGRAAASVSNERAAEALMPAKKK
jgi:hypothetical protein